MAPAATLELGHRRQGARLAAAIPEVLERLQGVIQERARLVRRPQLEQDLAQGHGPQGRIPAVSQLDPQVEGAAVPRRGLVVGPDAAIDVGQVVERGRSAGLVAEDLTSSERLAQERLGLGVAAPAGRAEPEARGQASQPAPIAEPARELTARLPVRLGLAPAPSGEGDLAQAHQALSGGLLEALSLLDRQGRLEHLAGFGVVLLDRCRTSQEDEELGPLFVAARVEASRALEELERRLGLGPRLGDLLGVEVQEGGLSGDSRSQEGQVGTLSLGSAFLWGSLLEVGVGPAQGRASLALLVPQAEALGQGDPKLSLDLVAPLAGLVDQLPEEGLGPLGLAGCQEERARSLTPGEGLPLGAALRAGQGQLRRALLARERLQEPDRGLGVLEEQLPLVPPRR